MPEAGAGFSGAQESVIERRPSSLPPRLTVLLALVLALVVAAVTVSWLRGDDPEPDEAEAAAAATTEPPATTAPEALEPATRTTLPPPTALDEGVADLPPVRPAAELIATLRGDPTSNVEGFLFRLDLLSGAATYVALAGEAHTLVNLDGTVVVGIGRDVLRVEPETGDTVVIAEDAEEILPAYGPAGVVAVVRSAENLFARVLGLDGVFRSAVYLPNEARVHGAIGDHVLVSMAGRVMAVDGRNQALQLGNGRVLAVGDRQVVRLQCEQNGCQITDTSFSATLGEGGGEVAERIVEVPAELAAAPPDRWNEQGLISPDRNRLAIRLLHGDTTPAGVVVVDLNDGWGRHSPEIGVDLGRMAWAPDSRFLLYTFENDVMVWDVEAVSGQIPSGRASVGEPLEHIVLRSN